MPTALKWLSMSRVFAIASLSTFIVPRAQAWGKLGHRTVAIIAEERLSPAAHEKVREILGRSTLASIATCADDIKRHPVKCGPFDVNANHRSSGWHFIDIPVNATPTAASMKQYCANHGRHDECSTEQMKKEIMTLRDPEASLSQKQIALMFLIHLMGDIHQPLHNATENDAGGNAKLVHFMETSRVHKAINLHHLWDNVVMKDSEQKKWSPEELAQKLSQDIAGRNIEAWTQGDIIDSAALESFSIAKTRIYQAYAQNGGDRPGRDYQREMRPIAFEQIEKAGVRLAFVLNQIWH